VIKFVEHIPAFVEIDTPRQVIKVNSLEELFDEYMFKQIRKLDSFVEFKVEEDKYLMVYFNDNSRYVVGFIYHE